MAIPVIGGIKVVGSAIGSALQRAKAKRQEKRAAKAAAAAQDALQRSEQLAARAGIGGSMFETKVSKSTPEAGAVESKFVSDVKQGFAFMEFIKKNIVAVGIGSAAFIGFVLWLIFRKKRKRR
jgi:hypothetical protein